MNSLHDKDSHRYQVAALCRLFGKTKQAYYKECKVDRSTSDSGVEEAVISFALAVREKDNGIGCRKLWEMYRLMEGQIGRDRFESILSGCGLILRRRCRRTRTTDSRHNLPLYPNLVYEMIPTHPDQIWVSDITYIALVQADGTYIFCYLSIVMDAYTRQILGWAVGPNLSTVYPLAALRMAIDKRKSQGRDVAGTIHHSDRGVQYASKEYIDELRANKMRVSMTERGDPKDNPQAERINNTVKNELLRGCHFSRIGQVRDALVKAVPFYNDQRPHMSLDMMTPDKADCEKGQLRKRWTSYRDSAIGNNAKNLAKT